MTGKNRQTIDSPVSAPENSEQSSILNRSSRIYVAGHKGMVGAAIVRKLQADGFEHIITRSHSELDLTDHQAVRNFFQSEKVDHVVLAAAKVGGIYANNTYPAEFIYTNLMIQTNVIHEAWKAGVEHLLFLGSSCIYPKLAPQPIKEEYLLTGELEPTNEPYAIAKIAGIKMCEAYNRQYGTCYRSVMPTNLYGPGDNYHLLHSHVIPAMIRKFHLAKLAMQEDLLAIQRDEAVFGPIPLDIKQAIGFDLDAPDPGLGLEASQAKVVLWGTGKARREFLHVDDMASACVHVMGLDYEHFSQPSASRNTSFVNIGTGIDQTIAETAELVKQVVGFEGDIVYDQTKPDGAPWKLLDTSRMGNLGWWAEYGLREGLEDAYKWYLGLIVKS